MAVIPMPEERKTWTDERLDDLSKRMDEGFHRNDVEHQEFRREMKAGFDSINARFDGMNDSMNGRFDGMNDSMNARFDSMNERFDSMNARFDGMNDSMNARFDSIDARFDSMNERFEKFAKMLILIGAALIGTLITALISAIVAAILLG